MRRSTQWILRLATAAERANWNNRVAGNPGGGSFLQAAEFAEVKAVQGWWARYLVFETPAGSVAALALVRRIGWLGELWYFPKGPGIGAVSDVAPAVQAIRDYIRQQQLSVFLLSFEPELPASIKADQLLADASVLRAQRIQPSVSTIILPVQATPEAQLQQLGRRARRYIRRAQREGVTVRRVELTPDTMATMYSFMQTAFGGRGIPGLRPYHYYARFWQAYSRAGAGQLYMGFEGDTPTVGAFVVCLGKKAAYKDGGSRPEREASGAAYYLHWHIMNQLAREGVTEYDLWGSPPSDRLDDTTHHLWGVGNFKAAFSKDVTDYIGVLDVVVSPYRYWLWQRLVYPMIHLWCRISGRLFW